jgi:hypothetical protein
MHAALRLADSRLARSLRALMTAQLILAFGNYLNDRPEVDGLQVLRSRRTHGVHLETLNLLKDVRESEPAPC